MNETENEGEKKTPPTEREAREDAHFNKREAREDAHFDKREAREDAREDANLKKREGSTGNPFNVQVNAQVNRDVFGTVWSRFIFGPAMFLVLVMLLIVTVLDYRAKIVFDSNQQIIVQTLTNFIQEERLNNRKLIESADLSYEQSREVETRIEHDLTLIQNAAEALRDNIQNFKDENAKRKQP